MVAVERVNACGRAHASSLEVLAADHARIDVCRRQRDRTHLHTGETVRPCNHVAWRTKDERRLEVPYFLEVEIEQLSVDRVQIRALLHPAALRLGSR